MAEKWLRTGEVAQLLGVAPSTVYRRIEAGKVPAEMVGDQRRVLLKHALAMRAPVVTSNEADTETGSAT